MPLTLGEGGSFVPFLFPHFLQWDLKAEVLRAMEDGRQQQSAKLICAVPCLSRAPASCPRAFLEETAPKRGQQGWAWWDRRELSVPRGDVRLQEYNREQGCLRAQMNGEILERETQGRGVTCWKMFILNLC